MEAPRGVQVSAAAGDFKAICRKELHLQSTEGEVSSEEQTLALYSGGGGGGGGACASYHITSLWFPGKHKELLHKIIRGLKL